MGRAREDVEALLGAIRPECAGFQFVDQGLKFPQHNVIGHHLKGEDAHVPRFITQLTGSWRNTRDDRSCEGAPTACEKQHGLAEVCILGLCGEATAFLSTQQTLLTGAWGHGAACFVPFPHEREHGRVSRSPGPGED